MSIQHICVQFCFIFNNTKKKENITNQSKVKKMIKDLSLKFFLNLFLSLCAILFLLAHVESQESHNHDLEYLKEPIIYQDFTFVVSHFNSSRQYGKCLNMIVKYRYQQNQTHLPEDYKTTGYFLDYREVREMVMKYAQPMPYPSPLGMPSQWELVNQVFAQDVLKTYEKSIVAISSQIMVLSQSDRGEVHEPGTHGSIVTIDKTPYTLQKEENKSGYISNFIPLNEPWLNAFQYDCTLQEGNSLDNE